MENPIWEKVRTFYSDNFGLSENLVDLMASSDILLMCVSGSSNDSISRLLNVDEESVTEVVKQVLEFDGWAIDLPLNPYSIFTVLANDGKVLFRPFRDEIVLVFGTLLSEDSIKTMFRICRIYDKIERKLERDWK